MEAFTGLAHALWGGPPSDSSESEQKNDDTIFGASSSDPFADSDVEPLASSFLASSALSSSASPKTILRARSQPGSASPNKRKRGTLHVPSVDFADDIIEINRKLYYLASRQRLQPSYHSPLATPSTLGLLGTNPGFTSRGIIPQYRTSVSITKQPEGPIPRPHQPVPPRKIKEHKAPKKVFRTIFEERPFVQ